MKKIETGDFVVINKEYPGRHSLGKKGQVVEITDDEKYIVKANNRTAVYNEEDLLIYIISPPKSEEVPFEVVQTEIELWSNYSLEELYDLRHVYREEIGYYFDIMSMYRSKLRYVMELIQKREREIDERKRK